jgi:hypothetical protein
MICYARFCRAEGYFIVKEFFILFRHEGRDALHA